MGDRSRAGSPRRSAAPRRSRRGRRSGVSPAASTSPRSSDDRRSATRWLSYERGLRRPPGSGSRARPAEWGDALSLLTDAAAGVPRGRHRSYGVTAQLLLVLGRLPRRDGRSCSSARLLRRRRACRRRGGCRRVLRTWPARGGAPARALRRRPLVPAALVVRRVGLLGAERSRAGPARRARRVLVHGRRPDEPRLPAAAAGRRGGGLPNRRLRGRAARPPVLVLRRRARRRRRGSPPAACERSFVDGADDARLRPRDDRPAPPSREAGRPARGAVRAAAGLCGWVWLYPAGHGFARSCRPPWRGRRGDEAGGRRLRRRALPDADRARRAALAPRRAAALAAGAAAFALGVLPWRLWLRAHEVENQASVGRVSDVGDLASNVGRVPRSVGDLLVELLDPRRWLLLVPLAAVAVVLAARRGRKSEAAYVAAVVVLGLAGLALAFATSDFELAAALDHSGRRVGSGLVLLRRRADAVPARGPA